MRWLAWHDIDRRMHLLILITLLPAAGLRAQASYADMHRATFDYFFKSKYDSALYYYSRIGQATPIQQLQINLRSAQCWLALKDTIKAEEYFLRCLAVPRNLDSIANYQGRACNELASLYYQRKELRKSLDYLKDLVIKYQPLKKECNLFGGNEGNLDYAYRKALCYEALGQADSAFGELAPIVFYPLDIYTDPGKYEDISFYFAGLTRKIFGQDNARETLRQALGCLHYSGNYRESGRILFYYPECSIRFGGVSIRLDQGGGLQVEAEGNIPVEFSRAELLKGFMASSAYKHIMNDR